MSRIATLFPATVVCEESAPDAASLDDLFPAEQALVERAVERRRLEFAAGRACARRALGRLGVAVAPLLNGEDRAPQWPEGIVGSITHTGGYCAAVVAEQRTVRSVGVDAEGAGPIREELWRHILTDREADHIIAAGDDPDRLARLYFSAKEAFYKCQYPLTRTFLGFHDAEVHLVPDAGDPDRGRFPVRFLRDVTERFATGDALEGRFIAAADYVMTGVTLLP